MRHLLFLVTLIAVLSCSNTLREPAPLPPPGIVTQEIPVWVDSAFTRDEVRHIHDAIETWNGVLNGYIRFYIKSETKSQPSINPLVDAEKVLELGNMTFDSEPWDCKKCLEDLSLIAYVPGQVGDFHTDIHVISSRLRTRLDYQLVMEHEIGHVLGLGHFPGIMATPSEALTDCIDRNTVTKLAQLKHWNVKHLNPECT